MGQRVILRTPSGNWWGSNDGELEIATGPFRKREDLIAALDGVITEDDGEPEIDLVIEAAKKEL